MKILMKILICIILSMSAAGLFAADSFQELTRDEISRARKIYVTKCAKCHRFYDPEEYSDSDWEKWMKSMAEKSKLKPEQEALLTRYLKAYREGKISIPK